MGKAALAAGATVFASLALAFAATGGGGAAPEARLGPALARTVAARSERYAIHVRLTRSGSPFALHIRGRSGPRTISVALRLAAGTTSPGMSGAALLDGPFLYERAPGSVALSGTIRWLRLDVLHLPPGGQDLAAVHAMTPAPLLRVLAAAHIAHARRGARTFHGTVAYDTLALRGLSKLMAGIEFRALRISAQVGRDGLVHRIVLTGRTVDGRSRLSLRAHLFAFGKPVHVTPPAPGTYLDDHPQPTA